MRSTRPNPRTRVVAGPAQEPITLAELKEHLRITSSAEDAYLTSLITSTRILVEEDLGRKLITQDLELFFDIWPGADSEIWDGVRQASRASIQGFREFELPWLPAQSVEEISTFNDADVETVFADTNYIVDVWDLDLWGRVVLRDEATWPPDLREARSIRVQYKVGYGDDPADVPASIRHGLLMAAGWMYENRGDCPDDATEGISKSGAGGILAPYRVKKI